MASRKPCAFAPRDLHAHLFLRHHVAFVREGGGEGGGGEGREREAGKKLRVSGDKNDQKLAHEYLPHIAKSTKTWNYTTHHGTDSQPQDQTQRSTILYINQSTPPASRIPLHTLLPLFYLGWVGVGWQRHCKTCRSLRELDNQGTVFCLFVFLAVAHSWLPS